jgi:trehalose 6-phosphate synthase/phosphatase
MHLVPVASANDPLPEPLRPNERACNRLIVVSNRLPVVVSRSANGAYQSQPGSGGLVTALMPVLKDRGGLWIGWTGTNGTETTELKAHLQEVTEEFGYAFEPVGLREEEVKGFYQGFSNEIIWPLFHDLLGQCRFDPAYWRSYVQVNRRYARAIAAEATDGDLIWVHDYHLMRVATDLRASGVRNRLGFFLHIPFPAPDMFLRLPWRVEILRDLLNYDLIGFQTLRDRRHFVQCLRTLYNVKVSGKGQVQDFEISEKSGGRTRRLRVGAFPISIDYREFAGRAASTDIESQVAELKQATHGRQIISSVDRLDYTKGILAKLEGFRMALHRFPELIERAVLHLQVVPSRESIPGYRQLRLEIERTVSEINGRFTRPGRIPIHYYYQSLQRDALVAHYRAADVMLVTPFKDGMNLVAKEYCSCQTENDGVLVLSEFAGAAAELQRGALLVNPYDVEGMAAKIQQAIEMPAKERKERMMVLRKRIRRNDIFHWVNAYLQALSGQDLSRFPTLDEYVPESWVSRYAPKVGEPDVDLYRQVG